MADEEFFLCSKDSLLSLSLTKLHIQQNCRECSKVVTYTIAKHELVGWMWIIIIQKIDLITEQIK